MSEDTKLLRSCCEDESYLEEIQNSLPKEEELPSITCVFKALSDPIRVKILYALLNYEICVGEMVRVLDLPQSHVSHQLKILREKNIVTFRKHKKMSFYRICNKDIKSLLETVLKSSADKG